MYGELPELELADGSKYPAFPVSIPNPPKVCALRLPTNDELLTYLSSQRTHYRTVGRGGEGEDVPTPKADLALFKAIRLDKSGVEFDPDEALYAITQITRHRVDSCDRDGQNFIVKLMTMFGPTEHVVSIPFQKDIAEYRRNVYKARDLGRGLEERRFPPEVPVKLYDKVVQKVDGYAGGDGESAASLRDIKAVPPHHKRSVIYSLVSALDELDPSMDPN
jgi:hypothetical protein